MHVAIYLPLVAAAVFGLSSRWLAGALPPATATLLLTAGAMVTSVAASFSLGVLAFLLVARVPPAAELAGWSPIVLQSNPVPPVASLVAALVCVVVVCMYVTAVCRQVRAALSARAHCAHIGGEPGRLVVVDADHADAYVVSARQGRIVVTRPLLRALAADERRTLLAHERAHLDHHHHHYRLTVALAAAICPLLRPAREAVLHATERWADEAAADHVGNRRLVATTLARAGLLVSPGALSLPQVLRASGGSVTRRVYAMLAPRQAQRPLLVAAMLGLLVLNVTASLDVRADTERLLEAAFTAWSATG